MIQGICIALCIQVPFTLSAQEALSFQMSEGKYSTDAKDKHALSHAYDDLSENEIDSFILGKSFLTVPWVQAPSATSARDGLGPLYNANTCISCHAGNGGGIYNKLKAPVHRSLVFKLSQANVTKPNTKNKTEHAKKFGFNPDPVYGSQLNINAINTVLFEGTAQREEKLIPLTYADGTIVNLQQPVFSIKNLNYGELHKDTVIAARIALPLIGLGEIEKIPEQAILSAEDINDRDNNGISGRANYVYSLLDNKKHLGRFLAKASVSSVKQQVASALHNDMSLTTSLFPKENCTPARKKCLQATKGKDIDVPMHRLDAITFYITHLKIPQQRDPQKNKQGARLFTQIGCNLCHTTTFTTDENNTIHPFSDFLLHDMGKALSDSRTEFSATAQEWRTAPLWGVGLKKIINKYARYLHDGRAATLEEAILWHAGEASSAANKFIQLDASKRQQIIKFLRSL